MSSFKVDIAVIDAYNSTNNSYLLLCLEGEVPEWLNGLAWKACRGRKASRGFESRPLRH